MWQRWLRQHFPYAAAMLLITPLVLGHLALFVLMFALVIGLVPLAYGQDVDEIVERTFDPDRHDRGS